MCSDELVPSKMPDPEIARMHQDETGNVTLTLKKGKFEEFLFAFLGNKESLSKIYKNDFIVKLEDILQFHYLLLQKIEKEQFISLSMMTAVFRYDDNTSRTINTIKALEAYLEYRDVGVNTTEITWHFLFKLPDNENIQQQKVSIFFNSFDTTVGQGTIKVTIDHTNQVWATEVLRLFEEHISKITTKNTIAFRILRYARSLYLIHILWSISILIVIGAGIYILVQRANFLSHIKVGAELMWDLAYVVSETDNNDVNAMLQFFLIRDLKNEDKGVIDHLKESGYIDPKYHSIIDKMVSGYYKSGEESARLHWSVQTELNELEAKIKIISVDAYLRFVLLYVLFYILSSIYLKLFKMKSILALTDKGIKTIEKQDKTKSITVQFAYGFLSSLLAACVYEYAIKLYLL